MEKKVYEKPISEIETLEPLQILSGSGSQEPPITIQSAVGEDMDGWEVTE